MAFPALGKNLELFLKVQGAAVTPPPQPKTSLKMNKAIFFAAALSITPLPAMSQQAQRSQDQSQDRQSTYSERGRDSERGGGGEDLLERLSKSDLRDRLSSAVQRIEVACGEEIERFCSDVTPGGGRMASCMDAYSDQLSRSCQSALRRSVNRVQQAVASIADSCMSAVQQQCGNADNVKQCSSRRTHRSRNHARPRRRCAAGKAGSGGRQRIPGQGEMAQTQEQGGPTQHHAQAQGDQGTGRLAGLPAFSSDGKNLGQVVHVERGPDGKIQSVQEVAVGRLLGLGEKTITIDGTKLEQLADRIKVMMNSDQIRTLPDTKDQGGSAQK